MSKPPFLQAAPAWRMPGGAKRFLWVVMFLMGLAVLYAERVYLDPHNPQRPEHMRVLGFLLPHGLLGSIAMLAGPLQFSGRLRRRFPSVHRITGYAYCASVFAASSLGIAMPLYLHRDIFYVLGTIVHAGAWFVTTLVALQWVLRRRIEAHRCWMVLSYAMTFSFIVVRVILRFLPAMTLRQFGIFDAINCVVILAIVGWSLDWRRRMSGIVADGTETALGTNP